MTADTRCQLTRESPPATGCVSKIHQEIFVGETFWKSNSWNHSTERVRPLHETLFERDTCGEHRDTHPLCTTFTGSQFNATRCRASCGIANANVDFFLHYVWAQTIFFFSADRPHSTAGRESVVSMLACCAFLPAAASLWDEVSESLACVVVAGYETFVSILVSEPHVLCFSFLSVSLEVLGSAHHLSQVIVPHVESQVFSPSVCFPERVVLFSTCFSVPSRLSFDFYRTSFSVFRGPHFDNSWIDSHDTHASPSWMAFVLTSLEPRLFKKDRFSRLSEIWSLLIFLSSPSIFFSIPTSSVYSNSVFVFGGFSFENPDFTS